ncbi:DEMETER-like protein 3 isoform X2 [Bidens hawaiensis]|uniref:DEMETER-like protein 3 isoform X2 n=1 Tax=Bidens hawaiensis TaxID=980011 RepID=UPI004049A47A
MEVYGLGIKSTECLRLLTLRQRAFPVDRHVCRIVVRLGWVPLGTLPDGVLLHQLNKYPNNEDVQEYLSRRLSILDVDTLYELHYQMITFGKVFCTKTKPNCNSCPLKNECKHFASASIGGGEKTSVPTTRVLSTPELVDIEDLCLDPMVRKTAGRLRTKHQVYVTNLSQLITVFYHYGNICPNHQRVYSMQL